MAETQQTIADWINETFGESTPMRDVVRANEEMAELVEAYEADPLDRKIPEEAADVTIVLCRLAQKVGIDTQVLAESANRLAPAKDGPAQANKSMSKLMLVVVADPESLLIQAEIGAVVMRLAAFTLRYGVHLWDAVWEKMTRNRLRTWKRDGTGCGYHVKGE